MFVLKPRSVSPPFIREAVQRVGPSVVRIDCDREVSSVMALFSNAHMEGDTIRVMGTGIVASAGALAILNNLVVILGEFISCLLLNFNRRLHHDERPCGGGGEARHRNTELWQKLQSQGKRH